MKKPFAIALTILIATSNLVSSLASACSTFVLYDKNNVFYAHHLDERGDADGVVMINKRGTQRTSVAWQELTTGIKGKNIDWQAKWGSITFNMMGVGMPDGGVNEKGLYIEEMSLAGSKAPLENRTAIYASSWIQYVLDNFDSVDQTLDSLNQFSIDGMEWHYLVADAKGNRAVIELTDGNIIVHKNNQMPIPVLANGAYAKEKATFDELLANQNLPVESFDRFSKGACTYTKTQTDGVNMDRALAILDSLKQDGTRWTHLVDFKHQTVYLSTSVNSEWRNFSWAQVDFKNGPTLFADINRIKSINDFQPITKTAHSEIAERGLNNLYRWLGKDLLENYLKSIGSSTDIFREELLSTDRWQENS